MADDRLKELVIKRAGIKRRMTNLKKHLETQAVSPDLYQLRLRRDKLLEDMEKFEKIQSEIETLADPESAEEQADERDSYEEDCFTYQAKIETLMNPIRDVNRDAPIPPPSVSEEGREEASESRETPAPTRVSEESRITPAIAPTPQFHVSLPQLSLPKFSGSYEAWPGFADSFKASVHNDSRFADAQKLAYLRSCLVGRAADKISELETTDANYSVAWNLLEKYYDDPTSYVNARVKAIFDLSPVNKPSDTLIGEILDASSKHYRALKAFKKPFLEAFPIYAVVSKLDEDTRQRWRERTQGVAEVTMEMLFDFLHARQKILEDFRQNRSSNSASGSVRPNSSKKTSHSMLSHDVGRKTPYCHVCKGNNHYTQDCARVTGISLDDRFKLVRELKLCHNCLRANHDTIDCRSAKCKKCGKNHHTLLHRDQTPIQQTAIGYLTSNVPSQVLLSTAIVNMTDYRGNLIACRVLLDSCSQSNFVTEEFARKLGIARESVNVPVNGINGTIHYYKESISVDMHSRMNEFMENLSFIVIEKLPESLPSQQINRGCMKIPSNVSLADPSFHQPGSVDALLGAEIFYNLLCVGQIVISKGGAVLQGTKLGWIVGGKISSGNPAGPVICNFSRGSLDDQIARFWEVEEGPEKKHLSPQEKFCEDHYAQNTTRDPETGRYTVRLPFNEKRDLLGESYDIALRRFHSLERSLDRKPHCKAQYADFMREYSALGHMTKIPEDADLSGYYLPHHAVIKDSSLTTKLRVVFDASAKTSTGVSLNDTLAVGPTLQEDLPSILTRFRLHQIVLNADIEKMYRQVDVHPEDRDYQKILWRESRDQPVQIWSLNTVTYGTGCGSHLAVRTVRQLAKDESPNFPEASYVMDRDLYVDNLATGAKTLPDARKLRDDLIRLANRGGMNLRQWASNEKSLISDLSQDDGKPHYSLDFDDTIKTLGVCWNASQDCLTYTVNEIDRPERITKREILSQIARLFDPLGLLAPVIVKAKMIMQSLWKLGIDWDETVPPEIYTSWREYKSELRRLHETRIDRKVVIANYTSLQLHGFCDASERAYGSCIYVRSTDDEGRVLTRLLCAKSWVAPLKSVSLPKLELCAAQSLARLYKTVRASLSDFDFDEVVFWSDSTVTLQWVKSSPHNLKTFISNRVAEIQQITESNQWRHVPTKDNSADLVSRGLLPGELLDSSLWFDGPSWLSDIESSWPYLEIKLSDVPETKPLVVLPSLTTIENDVFSRYSSFVKLKRGVAYLLRFIKNCREHVKRRKDGVIVDHRSLNLEQGLTSKQRLDLQLTVGEIKAAATIILRQTQSREFSREIRLLSTKKPLDGSLVPLNPFLDAHGILRVGGRLALSDKLSRSQKHQILLPRGHHVTTLIIRETHELNYHAGAQATHNALRQRFWLVNGQRVIRDFIKKCVTCQSAAPTVPDYLMGNLPKHRVEYSRPFLHTGVDYCGPFYVKEKRNRNRNKEKVYVAVFVCFATRAVHLEIVYDLTTEAFLAALRRFFSRRGQCAHLYSDNAKNFVGADNELRELYDFLLSDGHVAAVNRALVDRGIVWHFIPPRSPSFGGLWEAAVKSLKMHMTRVLGNTLLAADEFLTYVIEIEAILNSRPIAPLSSDPNDLNTLTPAHFLIGESLTNIPEHDFSGTPPARLSNWQRAQQMRQVFWKRWYKEYLHQLTVRKKWHTGKTNDITIGSIVMIKEDNAPPLQWPRGRVIAVHPGKDGIIRVATVKTRSGEYKRCIKKLAPLPIE